MHLIQTKSFQLAINTAGDTKAGKIAILLPGRLDTKDYENFNQHLEYLAKKGFYAVAVDPPGTWESPGRIELFSTTNYIKAVDELVKYFGDRPTLLLGHSRGGAVAAFAGTHNPNVSGLVLVNPSLGVPTPPGEKARETGVYVTRRDLPPGTVETKEKKEFRMSLRYFEDGAKYDDAEMLKECVKPKALFYSTDDEFNTPKEVEEIFSHIPEPKESYKISGPHDYRLRSDVIEEVNEKIGVFIGKYFSV